MTKDEPKSHFGGLWAPIREQATTSVRPAILFIGDCYFVRFHLDPADKYLWISSKTYVIEGDVVHYSSMQPEEEGDDIFKFKWKLLKNGCLEFNEKGRKTIWEPVTLEEMAKDGYPKRAFEKYRKAYAREGFSSTLEARVVEVSPPSKKSSRPKKK